MVYDCFPFFNELDVLELRLNILNGVVDRFVIVESDRTFSNKLKPFNFENNKRRFEAFLDKIIYIRLSEYPEITSDWVIENYQRNMIMKGLQNCAPDDTVIISDLDEIPNPEAIKKFKSDGIYTFEQSLYTCYLNNKLITGGKWFGSNILRYKDFFSENIDRHPYAYSDTFLKELNEGVTPTKIRFIRDFPVIRHGGWHFTYMGGIDKIKYKIDSFAHQEVNTREYNSDEIIARKIKKGLDLFDRKDMRSMPVRINASFPRYIVENTDKYRALIFPVSNAMLVRNFFFRIRTYLYYYCFRIPFKTLRKCKKALLGRRKK
jgi:beta-1,4-mannosyl-glycoprotein beta-1,4-N-acetylglucosaminyltransferase